MPATVTAPEDVRSEGEFEAPAVPGFVNLPILTNPERHFLSPIRGSAVYDDNFPRFTGSAGALANGS